MRIRTIKPEWLDDERLACASPEARVMSIALIILADDHGRGRASVAMLGGRVFPASANPREDAANAREELRTAKYILVYEDDGQEYYQIRNWAKHQRVDRPSASQLPAPPDEAPQKPVKNKRPANPREDHAKAREDAPSPRVVLAPDLDLDLDHGPGPGPGEERASATPLPDSFEAKRGLLLRAHRDRYESATGNPVPSGKNAPQAVDRVVAWLAGYALRTGQSFPDAVEAVLGRWWADPYATRKGWPLALLASQVDQFAEALPAKLSVIQGGMIPPSSHAEHAADAKAGGAPWD